MLKLLLFISLPLLEIYLLASLGGIIGGFQVVLLVVASFLLGIWVLRTQSQASLYNMRTELGAGRVPADMLWQSISVYIAGVLLLLPGVISDVLGLILLFPPTRNLLIQRVKAYLQKKSANSSFSSSGASVFYYSSSQNFGNAKEPEEQNEVFECTAEDITEKSVDATYNCNQSTDTQNKKTAEGKQGSQIE